MDKLALIVKATVNPAQTESFTTYINNLMLFFEKAKAVQLGHYPIKETVIGQESPAFIAIFEFPDRDAFNSVYESPAYKKTMIPLREKAFVQLEVYISQDY